MGNEPWTDQIAPELGGAQRSPNFITDQSLIIKNKGYYTT